MTGAAVGARWFGVTVATAARRVAADRSGIATAVVFYALVTLTLGSLWRAAAAANGGAVAGYSAAALTYYIAATEAATVALNMRMIEEIADDIAGGAVATELLRPASVVGVRVAASVGRALPRLAVCAGTGVVLCAVVAGQPTTVAGQPTTVAGPLLAAPSLVLAITCNLLAQHACAAAAFWVRDARSTWFLYQKLVFILGGMLLPLQVLPDGLHRLAAVLPFSAMAYAPARLASGHVEPELLLVQLGWLAALAAVARAAFAAGERRLQVVGG